MDSRPTFIASDGHPYDPFVAPFKDDPHPILKSARETAPVFWSEKLRAWVVTRYSELKEVFSDAATFVNAGGTEPFTPFPPEVKAVLAKGLPINETRSPVVLDGQEHARFKKFMVSTFTARRIGASEDRAREIANGLIDSFIAKGSADFVLQYAYRFPLTLLAEMIGVPTADCEQLHHWTTQKMTLQWGNLQGEALIAVAKDYVDFQMYLKRIIEKRRNDPTDDLISALVQMTQEGERSLSDAEIVGLMMGVIGAGHETTTNMLTLTLWQLLQNRAQWLAICTDKALIPGAVEEGLRFDSPAPSMWRRTTREVVLAGVRIPANERICVQLASGNRDELAFSDPASFDIRRKMQPTHLAFGHGIHFCVGAALARLEGRITFEALASKLPSLRLARDFTPSFRPNPTLRFMQRLPIEWDER